MKDSRRLNYLRIERIYMRVQDEGSWDRCQRA